MATTLRDLLIQRAARLQDRPALTAPEWRTLSYSQLRNRVEGVALGLLAQDPSPSPSAFSATGTVWDWSAELAAAASGLVWDPAGPAVPAEVLGGRRFNEEAGRGPYHAREQVVQPTTRFTPDLDQGEWLARLRRLNVRLGWDHTTRVELPLARLDEAPVRAALWSSLYAGAHAVLVTESALSSDRLARFRKAALTWNAEPFLNLWRP